MAVPEGVAVTDFYCTIKTQLKCQSENQFCRRIGSQARLPQAGQAALADREGSALGGAHRHRLLARRRGHPQAALAEEGEAVQGALLQAQPLLRRAVPGHHAGRVRRRQGARNLVGY